LRCQAQLELTFMMCLSDHSTSTGALSDRSTFTSTDARVTNLHHCFFWKTCYRLWAWVFARAQALSPPYLFKVCALILDISYNLIGELIFNQQGFNLLSQCYFKNV